MYVPATLPQPAGVLAPIEISASATPPRQARALISLSTSRNALNVLEGHATSVTGKLTAALAGVTAAARLAGAHTAGLAGRFVDLEAHGDHGWRRLAHTRTRSGGRFRLRYAPPRVLSEQLRLRFAGDAGDLGTHRRVGRLNVYRLAQASWYGGGGTLACGGQLTSNTMGVASKTLPCGTELTLRYGGRSVRVSVVDRGPYVAGREFDLTEATKQALGFGDLGEVWSTR